MILQNYWKYKYTINTITPEGQGTGSLNTSTSMIDTSGAAVSAVQNYHNANFTYAVPQLGYILENTKIIKNISLVFDSGDTEIEGDDYAMPDAISGISDISLSVTYTGEAEDGKVTIAYSGTNSNAESITIKRVGVVKSIIKIGEDTTISTDKVLTPVLIGYTDLEEPLTVPAGTGFTINLEWTEA